MHLSHIISSHLLLFLHYLFSSVNLLLLLSPYYYCHFHHNCYYVHRFIININIINLVIYHSPLLSTIQLHQVCLTIHTPHLVMTFPYYNFNISHYISVSPHHLHSVLASNRHVTLHLFHFLHYTSCAYLFFTSSHITPQLSNSYFAHPNSTFTMHSHHIITGQFHT